jgi:regulatory protein
VAKQGAVGLELRQRALRLLARREHSRLELHRKLARLGANEPDIESLLDRLQGEGKLSEARLVEQTVAIRGKRFGQLKLQHELRAKGVSEAQIEAGLRRSEDEELAAASAVWRRKFKQAPRSNEEKAKQIRFLQNRGFSLEISLKILKRNN